ncbi:hypothetical protein U1329_03670 [Enterococcus cecorum]|uniref:hypothetical protein n=1 Tax=Enterococcus cecorum TaxID=44008 RepID=UPI002ACA944C|nr:hypothetical protein [Enterococcus cecorum]MDZ5439605.1 hypothetical protein [Enterococcus cecorum]MDZ5497657.1 hypothetical protein [Enterococcus cecorum]MDZ5562297.1 hypothetical protein [Enterococcus cecorum]
MNKTYPIERLKKYLNEKLLDIKANETASYEDFYLSGYLATTLFLHSAVLSLIEAEPVVKGNEILLSQSVSELISLAKKDFSIQQSSFDLWMDEFREGRLDAIQDFEDYESECAADFYQELYEQEELDNPDELVDTDEQEPMKE